MTTLKVQEDVASIVLVGNFNPAIFQPHWLASKGLIRESEADAAVIEVVHPDVAQFHAGWLDVIVTRDKFVASTSDPSHQAPLRDLVVGVFELLEHTPTTRLGLNLGVHADLGDDVHWHALGHAIAPKQPWAGIVENPGMRALLVLGQSARGGPFRVMVRVEPSQKFAHSVFVDVNHELAIASSREQDPTIYFVEHIRADWEETMGNALGMVERLVAQAPQEGA
jgi:hypothetical protein